MLIANVGGGSVLDVRGGVQVDVFWGHEGDTFDPFAQVIKKTVAIHIDEPHGALLEVKSVMDYRQYTFQELASLARLSGFEVRSLAPTCPASDSPPQHFGGAEHVSGNACCKSHGLAEHRYLVHQLTDIEHHRCAGRCCVRGL